MKEQEQRETRYVSARLKEIYENPVEGNFDNAHLKPIHAYLFQDFPEYKPGVVRESTEKAWIKQRVLEGHSSGYVVHYANRDIEARITEALATFGGPASIVGKPLEEVAAALATLYGDLDHAHGFHEGNSRTLREFTRELTLSAGYNLDWIKTGTGTTQRNQLYLARDLEVLERAFPDLTPEKAMTTDDRAEYEASFVKERIRRAVGHRTLAVILAEDLSLVLMEP